VTCSSGVDISNNAAELEHEEVETEDLRMEQRLRPWMRWPKARPACQHRSWAARRRHSRILNEEKLRA
jgi:hypothetical protein